MGIYGCNAVLSFGLRCPFVIGNYKLYHAMFRRNPLLVESRQKRLFSCKCSAGTAIGEVVEKEDTGQSPRFNWADVGLNLTDEQDEAITRIPIKMSKRCQALMRQIICFSSEKRSFCDLLGAWVRRMKPIRADWLSILKELKNLESPFYIKVLAFLIPCSIALHMLLNMCCFVFAIRVYLLSLSWLSLIHLSLLPASFPSP